MEGLQINLIDLAKNIIIRNNNSTRIPYAAILHHIRCRLPAKTATCAIFGGHSVT